MGVWVCVALCLQVGEHFSRFGEVMDVVLVRDMAPVLHACEEASKLEQQRNLLTDQMRAEDNGTHTHTHTHTHTQTACCTRIHTHSSVPHSQRALT